MNNRLIPLLLCLLVISCVETDFEVPERSETEAIPQGTAIPLKSVLTALNQSSEPVITFEETNTYVTGYVTSSDVAGNFFRELIIQDQPANPTAGITLQLNQNALYTRYEPGRKVFIFLDGLSAARENGVIQLGIRDGNGISEIPSPLIPSKLMRSSEMTELVPLPVDVADFSDALENLYVVLNDAQFNRDAVLGESGKTFAGEATDEFDGIRVLETCDSRGNTLLSTSTFSKFKSVPLPAGRGSIRGILSRDFYDDFYVLRINTTAAVSMSNPNRCDPVELRCGLAENQGSSLLFQENFENQSRNNPITGNGWTNYIEYGTQAWEAYRATGTNASQGISARIDSYQSGNPLSVSWLITPAIELAAQSGVRIRFETSSSFADGSNLDILLSTDWDGTPEGVTSASWSILGDAFVIRDQDFFGDWYSSGIVKLSCATGQTAYIAFKYTGSGAPDFDGTYQLDNISITAD